eukprot:PhM_4_TR14288/c0_g1_i1/m.86260
MGLSDAKWATALWFQVVQPAAYYHRMYWMRKVALDQYLEKQTIRKNFLIGAAFGATIYLFSLPMRTFNVDRTLWQLRDDTKDMLELIDKHRGPAVEGELPGIGLFDAVEEVVSALLVARDEAEVKRMLQEVEEQKKLVEQLKESTRTA